MSATVFGRVRVRRPVGVDVDPSRAVARRLAGLDLAPAGIAPSAVLCVRRLDDPAPGTLRLDGAEDPRQGAWLSAVVSSVTRIAGDAARPADGPVPANTEAVLFRDRVELLACLAEAVGRPGGIDAWWWRGLGLARGRVADSWLRELRLVPAAVDLLERRGSLRVLGGFGDTDLVCLASSIATQAGLPAVVRAVAAGREEAPGASGFGEATVGPASGPASRAQQASSALGARIAALGDLGPLEGPALGFAVVALAVHRRPTLVRDPAFPAVISRLVVQSAGPWKVRPAAEPAQPRMAALSTQPGSSLAPPMPKPNSVPPDPNSTPGLAYEAVADTPAVTASGTTGGSTVRGDVPPPPPSHPAPPGPIEGIREAAAADTRAPGDPVTSDMVATDLGGACSLLVLALDLGLYGDFTQPAWRGLRLDPWDLVTMLATELGARDAHPDDPLWLLLDRLAGRPSRTRPGAGWRPPATWRVPAGWLGAVPAARTWTWSAVAGRLRVEHPAGFAIHDGRPPAHATSEVRRRLASGRHAGTAVPRLRRATTHPPLRRRAADRWVAELARYVRARLKPRLDVGDDTGLRRVLLERPARMYVGPGSVDVVMNLDELPVAVRAAGLDRDLGPVPAARRSVRFHYR